MLLTQANRLDLTKEQAKTLKELCRLSKNLFNVGLYTVRQYFLNERKHLRYESVYYHCKTNENYKLLATDIRINEIRVYPRFDARLFDVADIYESADEQIQDAHKVMEINLGVNNLAACISSAGTGFVIDGKRLKAVNQWYNKRAAKLQFHKDKQGIKGITHQQARITDKRNHFVQDYLNKAARYIINHCLSHGIGKVVVVGFNPGMKQEINLKSRNNQNFVQVPIAVLRLKIQSLCERKGIVLVEQEQSYTSKSSFVDSDPLPVWNTDNPVEFQVSGKRVKRGLYRTKDGHLINADMNGAANILRKYFSSTLNELILKENKSCLSQPVRVYLLTNSRL
ncbi:MAG: IS200/IS605 family element transposase accessory protein TnpB [Scytonema sp. RU_4_4]|nr:IS200/IS605 family element transposase accessory protein TnpB [Scytonema sp. RU_4_4]